MGWKLPLIIAGSVASFGTLFYMLRPRSALVIWSDDPADPDVDRGTFRQSAAAAGRALGVTPVPVRSAADLVAAIQRAPGNLGTVVLIGHGTSTKFLSPARYGVRSRHVGGTSLPRWITPDDLASVLAPKLARGAVISLAGCSAAAGPREPRGWTIATGWHGGADSLAGRIRDALARRGASGQVQGHTVLGTTLENPQGRTFYMHQPQRPGIHIMAQAGRPQPEEFGAYRDWNNHARGRVAMQWMLTGRVPRG